MKTCERHLVICITNSLQFFYFFVLFQIYRKKKYHLDDVNKSNAKGVYKNDLDDPGPTSFFSLVGIFKLINHCSLFNLRIW